MDEGRRTKLSKSLSYFLRHHLDQLRCPVSPDGFVPLSAILAQSSFRGVTIAEIEEIIQRCAKQRFALKKEHTASGDEEYFIRANQGHSIKSATKAGISADAIYDLITEPLPYCVHGTGARVLPSIEAEGLKKMNRTHIHLVSRPDAKSGFKKHSNVLVHIDMAAAMADGIRFYRSENDVILTEGVDGVLEPKYFLRIEML